MKADIVVGLVLGLIAAGLSAAGNVARAGPNVVSVFPDVITAALVPVIIYLVALRRRSLGAEAAALRLLGKRAGLAAGSAFALPFFLFSWYWFDAPRSILLSVGAAIAAFAIIVLMGWGAAAMVARGAIRPEPYGIESARES